MHEGILHCKCSKYVMSRNALQWILVSQNTYFKECDAELACCVRQALLTGCLVSVGSGGRG